MSNCKKKRILYIHRRKMQQKRTVRKRNIHNIKPEHQTRSTPRRMLPYVLKNNFLEDPALRLAKNVGDINELWKHLIATYGNPKIMLHKKMATLNNFTPLWKISNPEKISDGLIRIINLIKDLMRLSDKHKIKEKLYNGDGLERTYNLVADARLIRWLRNSSEIEVKGKNN